MPNLLYTCRHCLKLVVQSLLGPFSGRIGERLSLHILEGTLKLHHTVRITIKSQICKG